MFSTTATNTPDCSLSMDTLDRLVFDCNGRHFQAFPSGIPNNTLVLLLRRTMTGPEVPSFQTIGLVKLQVLDLSWNSINYLSYDTFKDMTSLLSLDIRGNNVISSMPKELFNHLFNLKALKIDGYPLSLKATESFIENTKSLKILDSFVYNSGDIKFGIQIASQYLHLTLLIVHGCTNSGISLAQHLHQLRNLTRLTSITIVNNDLYDVGENISLDWMSKVRNINFACNHLNLIDTVRYFGSQTSLSKLDTLILDHIDNSVIIDDINILFLSPNVFCNLSFSTNLRRLSIQQIGALYYEAALTRCLPNLRSISMAHNLFINVLENGLYVNIDKRIYTVLKQLTSLYFVKASYAMTSTTVRLAFCFADDITFDQFFIDESQFTTRSKKCEAAEIDIKRGYIKFPSCLQAFQLDHLGQFRESSENFGPISIYFCPNNSLELLDLSHSIFLQDGMTFNAISISGLKKLRILRLKHTFIRRVYMVTLNHTDNLEEIDLSDNRLEQMTAEQLSKMFTKPINVRKLNLSACHIGDLRSDFLRQFPNVTLLDLSYNKLPHLLLNLSWLSSISNFTIDFAFNQITTANDIFVSTIQQVELFRRITLNMGNNQFRCDYDTITFIRWFQSTKSVIEKKEDITCDYRGVQMTTIVAIDVAELEFECTKFMRILYISLSSVLSVTFMGIITCVLLFKYRWQIRWHWLQMKRKVLLKRRNESLLTSVGHNFICYVNYLGVTSEWIMKEIVTPIENFNVGDVYVYEKYAMGGISISDNVVEAINSSKKLLYAVGNDDDVGEKHCFYIYLQLAMVERLDDIIIVYKDVAAFSKLQKSISLLKSSMRNQIRHIEYEANSMFWPEIRHDFLNNSQEEVNS